MILLATENRQVSSACGGKDLPEQGFFNRPLAVGIAVGDPPTADPRLRPRPPKAIPTSAPKAYSTKPSLELGLKPTLAASDTSEL